MTEPLEERMTDELALALVIADRILDRPFADPDDDLAILARQIMRMQGRADRAEDIACQRHGKTLLERDAAYCRISELENEIKFRLDHPSSLYVPFGSK